MLHFATFPHMMVSVRVLTCSWKTNKIRLVFPYWLHIMLEKYFLFISSVGGFTYSCAGNWAARVDFLLFSHYWVKAKKTDNSSNNDKKACVKYTSCSYCRGQMSVSQEVLLQASQVLGNPFTGKDGVPSLCICIIFLCFFGGLLFVLFETVSPCSLFWDLCSSCLSLLSAKVIGIYLAIFLFPV